MEEIKPAPQRTKSEHRIAIQKQDGEVEVVEADEYRPFQCTTACVQFWATILTCGVLLVFGIVMLAIRGTGDTMAPLWAAMVSLGAGVLIPSPNYIAAFKVPRSSS